MAGVALRSALVRSRRLVPEKFPQLRRGSRLGMAMLPSTCTALTRSRPQTNVSVSKGRVQLRPLPHPHPHPRLPLCPRRLPGGRQRASLLPAPAAGCGQTSYHHRRSIIRRDWGGRITTRSRTGKRSGRLRCPWATSRVLHSRGTTDPAHHRLSWVTARIFVAPLRWPRQAMWTPTLLMWQLLAGLSKSRVMCRTVEALRLKPPLRPLPRQGRVALRENQVFLG